MNVTRINNLLIILFISASLSGLSSCKAKKAAAAAEKARLEMVEKTKSQLNELLANQTMTFEEKEAALAAIKNRNIDDPEVKALIDKLDAQLAVEREKRAAEERRKQARTDIENSLKSGLPAVAGASNLNVADQKANEILKHFNDAETTVLIIISKTGDVKDYDRPTTISKYLDLLKDRKSYKEQIENIVFDEQSNKIKLLELSRIK